MELYPIMRVVVIQKPSALGSQRRPLASVPRLPHVLDDVLGEGPEWTTTEIEHGDTNFFPSRSRLSLTDTGLG